MCTAALHYSLDGIMVMILKVRYDELSAQMHFTEQPVFAKTSSYIPVPRIQGHEDLQASINPAIPST
jgi:hypothetical protein